MDAARLGLTGMTHFYGLFESILKDHQIQPYRLDYNYQNEQHRFAEVAQLWRQSHDRGSEAWNEFVQELVDLGFFINPTMTIYEANRDVMRAREAEWHDKYTLPSMWDFYRPNRRAHGSYWFYWGTEEEAEWRAFYRKWMDFLHGLPPGRGADHRRGRRRLHLQELRLRLHRGAGAPSRGGAPPPGGHPVGHPVRRAGDLRAPGRGAAHRYHRAREAGRPDHRAENPLENLKVLYGTGAVKLDDETGEAIRVGGVRYTIKDGIVYDARQLLEDVAEMVRQQKIERGMDPDAPLPRY
jgi:hypothetical protein